MESRYERIEAAAGLACLMDSVGEGTG